MVDWESVEFSVVPRTTLCALSILCKKFCESLHFFDKHRKYFKVEKELLIIVSAKKALILAVLYMLLSFSVHADDHVVYEKLTALNQMRETLSSTLDYKTEPVDETTFRETCMPVGKELMRWAGEKGYQARQISHKNRNPANAVQESDTEIYSLFLDQPDKQRHAEIKDGEEFDARYYFRIPYVTSCGHCHGSKESRPDFVKQKYPEDAAYDFSEGDLRGVYVIHTSFK
jgi:hypothetical protein